MTGRDIVYLVGLLALLIAAALMIWRGGSAKPDPDQKQHAIGGGDGGGAD